MKALSLHQPWLWAVLHPVHRKHVENRPWQPPIAMIDQVIALHSTLGFDDSGLHFLWKNDIKTPGEYVKGHILGVATIDRIVTTNATIPPDQARWFFGEFGWLLKDVRALARPIKCRGMQKLWTIPPAVETDIKLQLAEAA